MTDPQTMKEKAEVKVVATSITILRQIREFPRNQKLNNDLSEDLERAIADVVDRFGYTVTWDAGNRVIVKEYKDGVK